MPFTVLHQRVARRPIRLALMRRRTPDSGRIDASEIVQKASSLPSASATR
jgi:hypothetical protein